MMDQIKSYIQKYQELLPVGTSISYTEAERRAGEFLDAMATISNWRHELGSQKIKATSVQTVVFSHEMSKGTAKTVTENKLSAEASAEYLSAREDLEIIDNDITYLKTNYDIFSAAHVFYRQMARGETI